MSARLVPREYDAYGIDPLADSAQTITVTPTPAAATNVRVTGSLAWKNPSSAWATGKTVTDYVTATNSNGGLTFTVTCHQPFGEQIIFTAVLDSNTSINASCTIDYKQKVSGVSFTFGSYNLNNSPNVDINANLPLNISCTQTVGTIEDNVSIRNVYFDVPDSDVLNYLNAAGLDMSGYYNGGNSSNVYGALEAIIDQTTYYSYIDYLLEEIYERASNGDNRIFSLTAVLSNGQEFSCLFGMDTSVVYSLEVSNNLVF